MQESALSTIGLPLALAVIMLGLGLHLRVADFQRIVREPRAMLIGLGCQVLLLPALCFALVRAFGMPPELAVGMMLLAASPGGTTANLYSHLFKGDVALNISLTAINSVLAIVAIPLIVNFALESFMGQQQYVPLQFRKTLEVIVLILTPVALGMLINARFPSVSRKMDKPVKIASALILALLIAAILLRERANLLPYFQQAGLPALIFNLSSMFIGYYVGRLTRLGEGQSRAIAFEVGIHNGTLAIYLALAVLNNSAMSVPAAIYSLIMFVTAALFGAWVVRRHPSEDAPASTPA
jgi:BASS family bile acid:Na+ symporter